jgi:hypothetical protein
MLYNWLTFILCFYRIQNYQLMKAMAVGEEEVEA